MGFSETIKLDVKRKAGFCCCICHKFDVEIHHIEPESEGGDNSIQNAAPLCPSCHDQYGGNPQKRKLITQRRDWWYEKVEEKYSKHPDLEAQTEVVENLLQTVIEQGEQIDALKGTLNSFLAKYKGNLPLQQVNRMDDLIRDITVESSGCSTSTIISTVFNYPSETESFLGEGVTTFTLKHKKIIDPSSDDKYYNGEGLP
jgi:hypothetical protein